MTLLRFSDNDVPSEALIERSSISNTLVIKDCSRAHSGKYSILAQNAAGDKRFDVSVLVQDVPGLCSDLKCENATHDSVSLSWQPPSDDGGSVITNYVVEKRELSRRSWTKVSMTLTRTSTIVQGLGQGESYLFRVSAENMLGVGPGLETKEAIVIKEPLSEYWFLLIVDSNHVMTCFNRR